MSTFKPIITDSNSLENVAKVDGQLIAVYDSGELYIDKSIGNNVIRTKYSDVVVDTFNNIDSLVAPSTDKIYFATDTHQLLQVNYGTGNVKEWIVLNNYTLPTASTSVLGGVKVDGTTITISNGVISSTNSGGSGISWVSVPSAADSTGTAGQVAYDSDYFYVCVATNTWKRTALSTWGGTQEPYYVSGTMLYTISTDSVSGRELTITSGRGSVLGKELTLS